MAPFRLGDLPLLTGAERRQVLDWAAPGASYPAATCLHELFEAQVARAPGAVAVSCDRKAWTYARLNARANRLAHVLRARGVGPEAVVALCLERSADLVAAILGVLKASGAYLPVDPEYPAEHVRFVLEDARAAVLLTEQAVRDRLPATGASVLCVDDAAVGWAEAAESNPPSDVSPGNLAYVIYTSGSTGRPKGVLVSHGNVGRLLAATEGWFRFGPEDVWTLGHSYAFDFSVWEIWGALAYGGRLVVVPEWVRRSPEDLYRVLADEQVTVLNQTPSAFRLLQAVEGGASALRLVIFGGEALDVRALQPWVKRHGADRPRLVNMYGITETTVHVTYHEVTASAVAAGESSIGVPIPDLRVYVLDARLEPVPAGVPGEVYVGGAGVARGYWQRPELTAERFIPDPYSGEAGARLYRTGDMARWRDDATLEYLGRLDSQVKLRGYRIEPKEIEAVLGEHAGVAQAVVLVEPGVGEEGRLVAYVAPRDGAQVGAAELRRHAQQRLPRQMVPAAWVMLGTLPLTPSGKVDRRALAAMAKERAETGEKYQMPRTREEAELARIWSQVLGVERVGVEDNFFALGGDSILSLQVVARARAVGLSVTPRQVFQHPNIAELAAVVGSVSSLQAEQGAVTGAVPLTPIQRWFFEQGLPEPQHFNQAVLLVVRAPLDAGRLRETVQHLLRHHDALRLRFTDQRDGWEQDSADWASGAAAVFEHVDLGALPEVEWASAIERTAARVQTNLDLTSGRLLRVVLFSRGNEAGRLLLVVHHLVVDGVSWRILIEDLLAAYVQLSRGLPPELPAKTTSFKRWAERLSAHARSDALAGEVGYWEAVMSRPVVTLPSDQAGGDDTVASAATVEVALTAEETQALLHEVPSAYRTQINDVLLTAVALTFASWTGEKALRLDLEGHGREELFEDVDLSRTVGWFTSLFPVRLELGADTEPGPALRSVKEQLREVPGRGLGYGVLRYLHPDETVRRRLATGRPSEVSFNYLGQLDQVLPKNAPLAVALESPGPTRSMSGRRAHSLEIAAAIVAGRLRVDWTFSHARHAQSTVARLAEHFLASLRSLIAHCSSPGAGGATPSDFPLARLTQTELDRLVGTGREVEDLYPLSALQSGLLFHTLYAPESGVYFEQVWCTIEGALDVRAFRRAWQGAVDRHAILRTGFVWEGLAHPVQVVRRRALLPWAEQDWRGLSAAEQRRRLDSHLEADRTHGFELGRAPLMRVALLRLGDTAWRFVWSHHHLLLDGWSLPLLLKEVLLSYEASVGGGAVSSPPSRPYRDFVAWLERQDSTAARAFWRRTLEGFTAPTPLVVERSPARGQPLAGLGDARGGHSRDAPHAEQRRELSPEATAVLERFARERQLTLNTLVQAAWALLLSRYSGEEDVLFGTTVSGRSAPLPGIEGMLGLFINTVPVRVRARSDERVLSWLRRLQDELAELRQYEWSPLADAQGQSELPRGRPLFESLVVFENYPIERSVPRQLASFRVQDIGIRERTNYPLTLVAVPRGRLSLHVFYDGERFDDASMGRMLGHVDALLRGLIEGAHGWLAEVPLLTAEERRQVLGEWAAPGARHPVDLCLHQLFEAQVGRAPGAVAVSGEGGRWTYGALNARANGLARALRARGVGPETVVGLCLERTVELVAAIVGVLKAGGAYLPVDPGYPAEHVRFLLEDAGVAVLVTERGVRDRLPATGACVLCVEDMGAAEGNPESGVSAGNLAYVMYTSGSTGRPKGVLISHGNVGRLLAATQGWFQFGPEDVWTLGHSYAFDFSVWELWGALAHGGRLVVVPEWVRRSPEDLHRVLAEEQVTVLNQTPSGFRLLHAAEGWRRQGGALALRLVIFGGEVLGVHTLRPWVERHGAERPRLVNMYGITETTVHVTYQAVTAGAVAGGESSIGVPIPDLRLYVLDGRLEPVPVGVPGEMYVGGAGLARGYWQRPGLTAERFIPDPHSGEAGARLYRTGDVGRWREDGRLEYLGRQDGQVKIRGVRIELGEIEGVLEEHAGVAQAVVVAQPGGGEDRRLVAYVVPRAGVQVGVGELRRHVQQRVPAPMVPAAWVVLGALPLTPSGKVDRRALPAPDGEREGVGEGYQAPRTEGVQVLARIWAEVLGVERVGVGDNFFALGGDSILSLQVVARARAAGLSVTPRQVFQYPSVGELAAVVGSGVGVVTEQGVVTGAVPLTPIQRWMFEQELEEPEHFNQALLLAVRVPLEGDRLRQAVEHLLRHHDALRLRFTRRGTGWEQVNAGLDEGGSAGVFEACDLRGVRAEEWPKAVEAMAARLQGGLDLRSGPLLRVGWFQLGDGSERVLLVAHHLVVDGVSWRILLEDLLTGYEQASRGLGVELPAKTTAFKQWAERLSAYAGTDALGGEVGYWEAVLSRSVGALPVDHAGGGNTVGSAATVEVALTVAETQALVHEVPGAYRTQINDVLLTAVVLALASWTGDNALRLDVEGHGREELFEDMDLSRTVGWFTSLYPVQLELAAGIGLGPALRSVKEQLRGVPGRGLGYGVLRYLHPDGEIRRRLAAGAAAEVSFNYLGQLDQGLPESMPFTAASEPSGPLRSARQRRSHALDINGGILEGRLHVAWTFSRSLHRRATIERVADQFLETLRALIAHCQASDAGGLTPSDFPFADLSQEELDDLVARAGDAKEPGT